MIQETRRWDDNKEYSYAMRSKEDAQDYRYFPEPDLVPICISDEWIAADQEHVSRNCVTEKLMRYKKEFDIPEYDAQIITGSKHMADIFEATTAICKKPKKVSNWLMVETMRLMKEHEMEAGGSEILTGKSGKTDRACRCRNHQQLLWQKKYLRRSS